MSNERGGTSSEIDRAVSKAVGRTMSNVTESILSNIDSRLREENSQTVEAVVKRAKLNRSEFKSKGNKQQYEQEDILGKMDSAKDAVEAKPLESAKRSLDEDTDDEKRIARSENRAAKKTKDARKKKKSFKSQSDYWIDRSRFICSRILIMVSHTGALEEC